MPRRRPSIRRPPAPITTTCRILRALSFAARGTWSSPAGPSCWRGWSSTGPTWHSASAAESRRPCSTGGSRRRSCGRRGRRAGRVALVREDRLAWSLIGVGALAWWVGDLYWGAGCPGRRGAVPVAGRRPLPGVLSARLRRHPAAAPRAGARLARGPVARRHRRALIVGPWGEPCCCPRSSGRPASAARWRGDEPRLPARRPAAPRPGLALAALMGGARAAPAALLARGLPDVRRWPTASTCCRSRPAATSRAASWTCSGRGHALHRASRPGSPRCPPGASAWTGWTAMACPRAVAAGGDRAAGLRPLRARDAGLGVWLAAAALVVCMARAGAHRPREHSPSAVTDALTGPAQPAACSPTAWSRRSLRARRHGERAAVLIDRPRPLQGGQRHAGPPRGRRDAARDRRGRLRDALRESDTVARLGGDEFAVLLPRVARRGGGRARSPTALGGAIAAPDGGRRPVARRARPASASPCSRTTATDADELLQRADVAMYAAKAESQPATALLRGRERRRQPRAARAGRRAAPRPGATASWCCTTSPRWTWRTGADGGRGGPDALAAPDARAAGPRPSSSRSPSRPPSSGR